MEYIYMGMDVKSRRALTIIRECVEAKRYKVSQHFIQRMDERGFFWPDVLAVLDNPNDVRSDGRDEYDRPKWIIVGKTLDDLPVELLCVLDSDDRGRVTVFVTIY